jgi:hypothetical protein
MSQLSGWGAGVVVEGLGGGPLPDLLDVGRDGTGLAVTGLVDGGSALLVVVLSLVGVWWCGR